MVLLRRVVAGKVETRLIGGEFHPKAYLRKGDSFDAPNAYKVIAALDLDGDGKMEVVVGFELLRGRSNHDLSLRPEKRLRFAFCRLRCLILISFSNIRTVR